MSFSSCVASLSLGGKLPITELRENAAAYQKRGMSSEAALERAVVDRLDMARMEERSIIATVRQQYEAKGGKPRPAPAVTQPEVQHAQEISQQSRVQGERENGNRSGQTTEAGGSHRVLREGTRTEEAARPAQSQVVSRVEIPRQVANFELAARQAWDEQWNALKNQVRAGKVTEQDAARVKEIAAGRQSEAAKQLGKLVAEVRKRPATTNPQTEQRYARQEAEIARAKESAAARRPASETEAQPTQPAKPAGEVVERYLGQYGKGMSQNNANAEVAKRNRLNDGITWRSEANEDLGYDRYEVVGYREQAEPISKSEAKPSGGMTAADVTKATSALRAKWLGFQRTNIVQSIEDLPPEVRARVDADSSTEGFYDPQTKAVYLIADNLASPERAAWVAAHEVVGHGGLRMLQDKSVNEALNLAGANRFVKQLAEAIQKDRPAVTETATEEAVAELAAAIQNDDFSGLSERYGVNVPEASRNGIRGVVGRVVEAVKRFIASITKQPVDSVTNADVRALVSQQQAAVEGRTSAERAPRAEPALASQNEVDNRTVEVDGVRHPITDSRGQLVAPDMEGQIAFWRNYKGPVNADGRPILADPTEGIRYSQAPVGEEKVPKWAENLSDAQKAALRKSGAIYTEKTLKQKVAELKEGALKKLQYGILDQFAPIKDQLGKIPYVLARMAKNADGTLESLMLYGRPQLDAEGGMTVDTTKKGFIETMQALQGEHDRFFSWMAGRRAEQLKKEGRENLFTDEDISALSTLNQGTMRDGSSREQAYLRAQKDVAELNKSVLDIAEKSGLIDPESRKIWQSDFYVPFYRVMEEGVTGPSIKSGLVNQKSIKKLKGGTNNLGDLTQNMLMNWSTLLTASAKNRAAKAALDAATAIGAATEATESAVRDMAKSAQTKAVSYMENGANRWHVVEDEHLLAAISALEFNGYNNQAMKVMSAFKNYLTRAVTSLPGFKVRNLIRDSIGAIGVAGTDYNPLTNIKNGYSLLRNKEEMAQLVAGGGIFRFGTTMEGNRGENVKRLIDAGVPADTILDTKAKMQAFLGKLWHGYQELGDLSENLNRAALYKKLRAEGKSHLEASFEARDLMDFGLSGAWAGVRALNQVLPFFNARLQGLYKLGRAYNDDPKRLGAVIGAVALASVALMMAYKDDDDFKKRTDSDRNNYWWFKIGDVAYRIPKPFEIGAAGSAIEHLTALMVDPENTNGKRFADQLGDLVNGQLAMNPIPQVFRPLIDIYSNKDAFTGRPIESMAMQRLRPEDRYTYNTSELARLLSKSGAFVDPLSLVAGTGVKQLSPVQIDSLIKGYFSGVGTLATSAVDGLLHHSVIDRGEALPANLKTFAGSFAEELPTNTSRYVDMLYSTSQDIEQSYNSYRNALKNGDIEEAQRIQRAEGEKIAKYHLVEALKRNESKITQQIQRTINSKELTGEQKEGIVKRLKQQQDMIARQIATRA
ncbi:MAG TPA: LPD38 domain-containing protein [Ramlibacter sp.]|nr:LPD38 domain-containing protein [Ramlibacter sp.]